MKKELLITLLVLMISGLATAQPSTPESPNLDSLKYSLEPGWNSVTVPFTDYSFNEFRVVAENNGCNMVDSNGKYFWKQQGQDYVAANDLNPEIPYYIFIDKGTGCDFTIDDSISRMEKFEVKGSELTSYTLKRIPSWVNFEEIKSKCDLSNSENGYSWVQEGGSEKINAEIKWTHPLSSNDHDSSQGIFIYPKKTCIIEKDGTVNEDQEKVPEPSPDGDATIKECEEGRYERVEGQKETNGYTYKQYGYRHCENGEWQRTMCGSASSDVVEENGQLKCVGSTDSDQDSDTSDSDPQDDSQSDEESDQETQNSLPFPKGEDALQGQFSLDVDGEPKNFEWELIEYPQSKPYPAENINFEAKVMSGDANLGDESFRIKLFKNANADGWFNGDSEFVRIERHTCTGGSDTCYTSRIGSSNIETSDETTSVRVRMVLKLRGEPETYSKTWKIPME